MRLEPGWERSKPPAQPIELQLIDIIDILIPSLARTNPGYSSSISSSSLSLIGERSHPSHQINLPLMFSTLPTSQCLVFDAVICSIEKSTYKGRIKGGLRPVKTPEKV